MALCGGACVSNGRACGPRPADSHSTAEFPAVEDPAAFVTKELHSQKVSWFLKMHSQGSNSYEPVLLKMRVTPMDPEQQNRFARGAGECPFQVANKSEALSRAFRETEPDFEHKESLGQSTALSRSKHREPPDVVLKHLRGFVIH